jgi:flagellar basal body-associated protein FliL
MFRKKKVLWVIIIVLLVLAAILIVTASKASGQPGTSVLPQGKLYFEPFLNNVV